ncbi:MAG: T9SS type A sorting domain-containing protein [Bacteroidales bacterium]|nr:T9SS type A sorting domain-containing protein [Bacteroidales bacterium]
MKINNYHFLSRIIRGKASLLLAMTLFAMLQLSAQDFAIELGRSGSVKNISSDNMQRLKIAYSYPGIGSFNIKSEEGMFNEIFMPDAFWIGELGTPKLPASKDLIEIPFGAEVSVKVLGYSVNEYKLSNYGIENLLMPVQPSVRKDQNVDELPFEFKTEIYEKDAFIAHEIASVEILGVMRGMRIARLTVAPVSYNPVKGIIRVFNDIEVEISYSNADYELTDYMKASTFSPYFEVVRNSLLNDPSKDYPSHPDLTKYPVKYLIVSPRMFESDLQPFIEWKTMKGFEVTVGYTDVIGTSYTAIQSWVHGQYNAGTPSDPAPSFLLIVGDSPQIPAITGSSSGKMTDLYYASVDGDYFPELYYGRFSATNSTQLQAQIAKTIYYEKYQFSDPAYLNKTTLIAGADATWNPRVGQATINYGTNNYFNAVHGYTDVYTYLTSPYTGCYDAAKIAVGFINYTAHCGETSWGDPYLSQSNVNAFTNTGKYPLAVGNCCLAADFGTNECIGETWQRAANKGSVAYIGSSPSSYWFEDFYWSVGAFPIQGTNNGYVPTFQETTWGAYDGPFVSDYVSTGGIVMVGNLAVTEVHIQGYPSHSSPLYYWQAYNVLGDPSLVVYHTEGSTNVVSHMAILPIGHDTYEVTALPGSYVAISKDGVLHGAALVGPSGVVLVPIQPVLTNGTVDIVVTKPQYIPYMQQVPAAALAGAYITLNSYTINDEDGNNNGMADYNEEFSLNVTLKNVGTDPSEEILATLSGSDPYVTLTSNATRNFGEIASGATSTLNDAYSFSVADNAPDQHMAEFELQMTDGSENWTVMLQITVNAPEFTIAASITLDDAAGNNNGQADPGETLNLVFNVSNSGHSQALNLFALLSSGNPYITFNTNSLNIAALDAGQSTNVEFSVSIDPNAPAASQVALNLDVSAGSHSANRDFSLVVGLIIEDFESGDFSQFNWSSGGNQPWIITNVNPYEGTYSAKSGTISDNQSSQLILEYDVAASDNISFYRKISSESNYDFLKFYINNMVVGQWSGDVAWSEVSYPVNAGTQTFKWEYMKDGSVSSGEDCAWIDNIKLPPSSAACPSPFNLHTTLISTNSAMANWSSGGGAVSWDLIWGTTGFDPETTGILVENLTATNYQLADLGPLSSYDFYVRSNCEDELSSAWSGPVSFTTLCSAFSLPFEETFSTTTTACWSYPEGQGNWGIGSSYPPPSSQSGPPNAFFGWSPTLTDYSHSLTSPLIDATGMAEIKLNFLLLHDNYGSSTLEGMAVEYKSVCSTEWILLEEFLNTGLGNTTQEYSRLNQALEGMEGKQFQVRFRAHGTNSFNIDGWGLDDILIQGSTPVVPGNLSIENIIIGTGEVGCYNATQTITVNSLTVQSGGNIELIAGTNILLNPGIVVEEGAYFRAHIASDYCLQTSSLLIADEVAETKDKIAEAAVLKSFFTAYPNPTTGFITLQITDAALPKEIIIEAYSIMGEMLYRKSYPGTVQYDLNLSGLPSGVYTIRLIRGRETGFQKIIKQ